MSQSIPNAEQARWIRRARKLFREVPAGLEFFATGDQYLNILDATKYELWSTDSEGEWREDPPLVVAERYGARMGIIASVAPIHVGAH